MIRVLRCVRLPANVDEKASMPGKGGARNSFLSQNGRQVDSQEWTLVLSFEFAESRQAFWRQINSERSAN